MRADFLPLQTLLLAFSGWTNRQQQEVIQYLAECEVLGDGRRPRGQE